MYVRSLQIHPLPPKHLGVTFKGLRLTRRPQALKMESMESNIHGLSTLHICIIMLHTSIYIYFYVSFALRYVTCTFVYVFACVTFPFRFRFLLLSLTLCCVYVYFTYRFLARLRLSLLRSCIRVNSFTCTSA